MTDAQMAPPVARPRRRGLLLPLLLITLGAVLFAGNFGYLPPISVRALLQLWPLLLVVFGIEMILARREPYLALAVEVLVVAAAVGIVLSQPFGLFAPVSTASGAGSVARAGASSLALRVEGGAGSYTVAGGASALVEARSSGGEISVRESRRGDAADVRVQPSGFGGDVIAFGGGPPVNVDVRVASDVPVSVRVSGGAGDFTVDLRDILLRDARIETGASKLELTLGKPSGDVPIRVQAGAATLVVIVPADVEVRITTSGGMLSTTTENARLGAGSSSALARNASVVETTGYAAAKDRVTLTIEAGASSITIR